MSRLSSFAIFLMSPSVMYRIPVWAGPGIKHIFKNLVLRFF